jgi:hypothetical protein
MSPSSSLKDARLSSEKTCDNFYLFASNAGCEGAPVSEESSKTPTHPYQPCCCEGINVLIWAENIDSNLDTSCLSFCEEKLHGRLKKIDEILFFFANAVPFHEVSLYQKECHNRGFHQIDEKISGV